MWIVYVFAGIGLIVAAKIAKEMYRTRKDDIHDIDTRDTGAF
jgi:hypothetical protein